LMDPKTSYVNALPKNFGTCAFCSMDFADVYRCPKCKKLFCGLKCYRSESHVECADNFYQTQIKQHVEFMKADGTDSDDDEPKDTKPEESDEETGRLTFEQYMEKHRKEDAMKSEDDKNPQIPIGPDEELMIDPEDEPGYLQDVLEKAMKDFDHMDDQEVNKQLSDLNLDAENEEELLKKLTPEELKAFRKLTEEMFEMPQNSCFK